MIPRSGKFLTDTVTHLPSNTFFTAFSGNLIPATHGSAAPVSTRARLPQPKMAASICLANGIGLRPVSTPAGYNRRSCLIFIRSTAYNMASEQQFVDAIIARIGISGPVSYRKMFGEYGLYHSNKLFALICDNRLFIKPTKSGLQYKTGFTEIPPYPGAKPCFLIEDKMKDPDWLKELVLVTIKELPEPRPKKKKTK